MIAFRHKQYFTNTIFVADTEDADEALGMLREHFFQKAKTTIFNDDIEDYYVEILQSSDSPKKS